MSDLVIFISHKLQSSERAKEIAGALSAFGGPRIRVHYSGKYTAGSLWRQQIENDLLEASWLILLYEGPQVQLDWCLFETGFFSAKLKDGKIDPRLICLHNPEHKVPGPIENFNPLPATQASLTAFFRQIYVDEPWKISPNIFQENGKLVISQVERIISEVIGSKPSRPYFAGPSFAIHIKVDEVEILKDGQIPPEAYLSGDGGWEAIFGKPPQTVSWLWRDIVRGLESPEPWIYPLATMMWQAYDFQRVQYPSVGVRIKFADEDVDEFHVFRLSLQRVDVTGEEVRFAFAGAAVVTPYEPANNPKETRLYHLYNLAWFFRRRLLERVLTKLDDALLNIPRNKNEIDKIIREISNDFRTMLADAQVRGMEKQSVVIQSFSSPLREEVMRNLHEVWPPLYEELFTHLKVGEPAAEKISKTLHNMEPVNNFFLKVSIGELNRFIDYK